MAFLNLTNDLKPSAIRKLKVGQVLIFDFEGSPVHIQIKKKLGGQVWGKRLDSDKFLTPEQADERVTITKRRQSFTKK